MAKVTLHRTVSGERGTFGVLSLDGKPVCVTCEDPWNDNRKGESCIPPGTYRCIKHSGAKYSNVWEVTGVKGRSAILIHNGNTINDTEGCILVGQGFGTVGGLPAVTNSVPTLLLLRGLLPSTFEITIVDPA